MQMHSGAISLRMLIVQPLTSYLYTVKACVYAMNISAQLMMKNAAKCDMQCELQNSVNYFMLERLLCLWDMLEGVLDPM